MVLCRRKRESRVDKGGGSYGGRGVVVYFGERRGRGWEYDAEMRGMGEIDVD